MVVLCNPEFPGLAMQEQELNACWGCLLYVGVDQMTTVNFLFQLQVSVILWPQVHAEE